VGQTSGSGKLGDFRGMPHQIRQIRLGNSSIAAVIAANCRISSSAPVDFASDFMHLRNSFYITLDLLPCRD
jgi:hypothetical protein